MKILSVDVGNTTIDACSFDGRELTHLGKFKSLEDLRGNWDKVLAVSVRPSLEEGLRRTFGAKLIKLEDIPLEVDYRTPETLGVDRVLFAYAVKEFYTEDAVLLSAGTALVIDLMVEGVFKGGFITAGLGLKLSSLSERAEGIPELKLKRVDLSVGRSTEECVVGGVFLEARAFVMERLNLWRRETGRDLEVFVTGGDGWFFEDIGTYDPLILHKGMLRLGGYL